MNKFDVLKTDETRAVEALLSKTFEQVDVYRYNEASLRVRVVDRLFRGLSSPERMDLLVEALSLLPERVEPDSIFAVCCTPEELASGLGERLYDFENPDSLEETPVRAAESTEQGPVYTWSITSDGSATSQKGVLRCAVIGTSPWWFANDLLNWCGMSAKSWRLYKEHKAAGGTSRVVCVQPAMSLGTSRRWLCADSSLPLFFRCMRKYASSTHAFTSIAGFERLLEPWFEKRVPLDPTAHMLSLGNLRGGVRTHYTAVTAPSDSVPFRPKRIATPTPTPAPSLQVVSRSFFPVISLATTTSPADYPSEQLYAASRNSAAWEPGASKESSLFRWRVLATAVDVAEDEFNKADERTEDAVGWRMLANNLRIALQMYGPQEQAKRRPYGLED